MRGRQPPGHVAKERRDLGLDPRRRIDRARGLQHFRARLLLHAQPFAQGRRQGGEGLRHGLGQNARALAAAGDQHVDRPARGRRCVGPVEQGADVGPDRIADQAHPRLDALRDLPQVRERRRDRADIRTEPAVGAAQHRILLVKQRRPPLTQRRQQGRSRRITAEADDHRRVQPLQRLARLEQAARDGHARLGHPDRPAPGGGVQSDPLLGRKGLGVALAPVVGGQHDPPAAPRQLARQRLGREHMAPGPSGGDDADLGFHTVCLPDAAQARHPNPLSSSRRKPGPSGAEGDLFRQGARDSFALSRAAGFRVFAALRPE